MGSLNIKQNIIKEGKAGRHLNTPRPKISHFCTIQTYRYLLEGKVFEKGIDEAGQIGC